MKYNYKEEDNYSNANNKYEENYYKIKNHNHEFESSTDYADDEGVTHNHSIAGTSGKPIKCGKSHIHKIHVLTDTFDDHFHEICDTTGPAIYIGGGKHIHLIKGTTKEADEHTHDYFFTTLIQDPTRVPEDKKCK